VSHDFQSASDEDLACQSQQGNLSAFEELVYRYEHRIYAFVYQCCGRDADSREITQDTFVSAFEAISRFDPKRPFVSWIFIIARRKTINCFRARSRFDDQAVPDELDADDPGELMARREDAQDLWHQARQSLSETQFQALWLRYSEEMDVAQIARVLGKTQTHVKVLLFRARHTLASKLKIQPSILPAPAKSSLVLPLSPPTETQPDSASLRKASL
jgi:RNA polymerase sigma-70 factor, ECF subfamily